MHQRVKSRVVEDPQGFRSLQAIFVTAPDGWFTVQRRLAVAAIATGVVATLVTFAAWLQVRALANTYARDQNRAEIRRTRGSK